MLCLIVLTLYNEQRGRRRSFSCPSSFIGNVLCGVDYGVKKA